MFEKLVLVVSTSAIACLKKLVSKMTYYVSGGTLNPTHSHHSSYDFYCVQIQLCHFCTAIRLLLVSVLRVGPETCVLGPISYNSVIRVLSGCEYDL